MQTSPRLALLVLFAGGIACTATHGSIGHDYEDTTGRGGEAGQEASTFVSSTGGSQPVVVAGAGGLANQTIGGGASNTPAFETGGSGGYATTSPVTEPSAAGGYAATTFVAESNCSNATNFIAEAASSVTQDWVGGDPNASSDNPCGIQGIVFAFSDTGLDGVAGTLDDAVQWPTLNPTELEPSARNSPCSEGRCCAVGRTYAWPVTASGVDYSAPVWGGGIGIELGNDLQAAETRRPYAGPARGFIIKLSGEIHGQQLRVSYNRTHADSAAPYATVAGLGMVSVLFSDARCPTWSSEPCSGPTAYPYEMLVQVAGGVAGTYTLCVEGLWPIL